MRFLINTLLASALLIVVGCAKQESPTPSVNIHVAAVQGNAVAIQQHIDAGTDLNAREPSRGSSPLITAVVFGHSDVAEKLIAAGADVNLQNSEGSTALHSAAFFCRTELVRSLLEAGADKNLRNKAGRTALESVSGDFEDAKGIYDGLRAALSPLGLKLDYEHLKMTRPKIAEMLQ